MDLLAAGVIFIASLVWASIKGAREKRRRESAGQALKPQYRETAWSDYGNNDGDDTAECVVQSASAGQNLRQPVMQQPDYRIDPALTQQDVVDDEAASTPVIDNDAMRQAVKWSVILEKKF